MKILEFDIDEWNDNREDIRKILEVLSGIKSSHAPSDRHWLHHSLICTSQMITTDVFPAEVGKRLDALEIELDPVDGVIFLSSQNESEEIPLDGQSQVELFDQITNVYSEFGIELDQNKKSDLSTIETDIDLEVLSKYWRMLQFSDLILKFFKSDLKLQETSQISLWSHHFDLSMLWLSGNLIDGKDPFNVDESRQQMNFGLSAGDDEFGEPYFYATAYPFDEKLFDKILSSGEWYNKNWNGAVLKFSDIVHKTNQKDFLLSFWGDSLKNYKNLQNI